MSKETQGESKGILDSLSRLAASMVAIAHTRLELLSNDLAEDRERLLFMLMVVLGALFSLGVGVVLLVILLVVAFWDSHRLVVLISLAGLFLAGGGAACVWVMHEVKTMPTLFAASLAELAKDRQSLGPRS